MACARRSTCQRWGRAAPPPAAATVAARRRPHASLHDCPHPCGLFTCTCAADPGTRPGLHGQTLVSSGHPDLDRLLGGGLPLGGLLLLLEGDAWGAGRHADTLLRYFLAEGAACGLVCVSGEGRVSQAGGCGWGKGDRWRGEGSSSVKCT